MSRLAEKVGFAALVVAVVVLGGVGVAVLPDPYPQIGIVAVVALFGAWFMPLPVLMFGWAAILPIWSIGPLPTVLFDVARFAGAVIIGLRVWAVTRHSRPTPVIHRWIASLAAVAILMLAVAWWHGASLGPGITMAMSVATVGIALSRVRDLWPVLLGFATGVTASAVVLVASALGVGAADALVPNVNPGYGRYTGLGTSSVRVSIEFAVAAIIWWSALTGRITPRLVAVAGASLSVVALLLSGGRTGLLGLGLAGLLVIVRGWLRPAHVVVLGGAMMAAIYWVSQRDVSLNTIERLTEARSSSYGLTTGRVDRLATAWERFLDAPLVGTGALSAHFAPLTFALAGGVFAGVIITVLSLRLGWLAFAGPRRSTSPAGRAGSMIAVVLFVTVVLEPTGPFLGVEMLTLLLATVIATSPERARSAVRAPAQAGAS